MVSGTRSRGDARLPGHRVRSYPVLPAVRRCSVHGPTPGGRPLTQGHHRGHHEVDGELGLRKDHHQVDRFRDVNYCTEKAASLMVNDRRFRQLDVVVDDAYEVEMNKKTVTYTLAVHVGFFVLQYAKMRMLQFYYDFINRYLERPLFQYSEMDTDSAYLALAAESVDDLVTRNYENITSGTAPNGCRPNVATTIGTSTCTVDSPIDRASATRRAVRRSRRTIRGHRVCSRWCGPVTDLWGCAARCTIVSDPPTNTAPKD